jgi:imidazole glycerol-phosphate synthase subunit HisF
MRVVRVVARLDVKGNHLVKGIHLEGLRVLGGPEEFASHYCQNGVDELVYQDVVASLYGRNSLTELIEATAQDIFVPLTVGGGIRSLSDVERCLRSGADRVAVNTAATAYPAFLEEIAKRFGQSTLVASIEAIRHGSNYMAFTDNGREPTGKEVVEWAKRVESLGAGEIFLTSVDREGTGKGFDLDLIRAVSSVVSIPVAAHGGAGKATDFASAVGEGASAVVGASVFHYNYVRSRTSEFQLRGEGNKDYLDRGEFSSQRISSLHVSDAKRAIRQAGFESR